jgi:hypothetical protein
MVGGGIMGFRPEYLRYLNYVKDHDLADGPELGFDAWLIDRGVELPIERIIINPRLVFVLGEGKGE